MTNKHLRLTRAEEERYHAWLKTNVFDAAGASEHPSVDDLAMTTFYVLTAPGKREMRSKDEAVLLEAASVFVAKRLAAMLKQRNVK